MDYKRFEKDNQRALRKLISICSGRKFRLVLQPCNKSFISRIVDGKTLKNTFEKIHVYDNEFPFYNKNYAMLIPPDIPLIKSILKNIDLKKGTANEPQCVQLWFQPRMTDTVAAFLVDTGYAPLSLLKTFPTEKNNSLDAGRVPHEKLEVYDLGIDILPLDRDCFTMNDRYSFLKGWILRDLTITSDVRQALDHVVSKLGTFASITCVGRLAKAVGQTLPPPNEASATHIIILDRGIDLITPCVTQMNYEGLIGEFLTIDCGMVDVSDNKKQLLATTRDPLYATLATRNHSEASKILNERMSTVTGVLTKKSTLYNECLEDLKNAAKVSLQNKTILDHINLAEALFPKMNEDKWFKSIMNAEADALEGNATLHTLVTSMIEEGGDLRQEARMLCLETLLMGGVPEFQKYVQQLSFNHGIQQVPYLMRLCDCGMLDKPLYKWRNLVKQFKLYVPEWEETGDEAAASYLGYAPLSIRIIQNIVKGDFSMVRRNIGDIFDTEQKGVIDPQGEYIVCFIGGCTHSELNTLRRLAPEELNEDGEVIEKGKKLRFKVLTTNMFTSNEFFESIAFGIPGWSYK